MQLDGADPMAEFAGLQPFATYTVIVAIRNVAGLGPASSPTTGMTGEAGPVLALLLLLCALLSLCFDPSPAPCLLSVRN